MKNTIRKIRTISTEGMVQQDIEVPEDKSQYGQVILDAVKEQFEAQPDAKAILVGYVVEGFVSRREEGIAFTYLRQAGYGWQFAAWDPKSKFTGLLITRT